MVLLSPVWLLPRPVQAQVTIHEPHSVQEIKQVDEYHQAQSSISRQVSETKPRVQHVRKTTEPATERLYSGRNYSKEEVKTLIINYSESYGISPETPLCIAQRESGFNQYSKNKSSSASGVFQYLSGTFKATDEGKSGLDVFDAEANVKAAIKYMAIHHSTKPWTVAKNCPELTFIK